MGVVERATSTWRLRQQRRRAWEESRAEWRLRDAHPGAFCRPYGCDYGIVPTDPEVLERSALMVAAAVECGDVVIVEGPEVTPVSPWRTHRRSAAGEFQWVVVGHGICRDAAQWLEARLGAELREDAARDEARKLLHVFCEQRWGPGPERMIVLTGADIADDRDVCNVLHSEARYGFDRVLADRGTQMVDLDMI